MAYDVLEPAPSQGYDVLEPATHAGYDVLEPSTGYDVLEPELNIGYQSPADQLHQAMATSPIPPPEPVTRMPANLRQMALAREVSPESAQAEQPGAGVLQMLNEDVTKVLPKPVRRVLTYNPTTELMKAIGEKTKTPALTGTAEGLESIAEGLRSPVGIGTMGMGDAPIVVQRAVSLAFAAQMASEMPEIATQLGDEFGKPEYLRDNKKIARLIVQGGGSGVMAGFSTAHGISPKVDLTPEFAKNLQDEIVKRQIGEPNAQGIRSSEGQLPTPGAIHEGVQETGGNVVEQHPPEQPKPVEERVQFQPEQTSEAAPTGIEQPISVGPGAASPGDVPPEPPLARAALGPESTRPSGVVTPSVSYINHVRNAVQGVSTTLKGMAGESLPKITSANREVGESGVRYASSRIASGPLADVFSSHTLEGTDVDPVKFGAALTEDNLRSVREKFRQQATEARAEGKPEEADAAENSANQVRSIVGEENSPFKNEDEYQDFLDNPSTQKAIGQHIQQWHEVVEPMYRKAQMLDPDVELPTRGLQTGARINLKVVFPEEASEAVRPIGPNQGPSLTSTFRRKSPFGIKAKGTGEVYEAHYPSIIENTFQRQLEIANKNAFDKALVDTGLAVIDRPGKRVVIDGQPAAPFPLNRRTIITGGKSFPAGQNIYVKGSLASEYRAAANVDAPMRIPGVTRGMNVLNRAALAGLTDFTIHTSNLATALFNRPSSGRLLADSLLSATGRADIPVTLVKAILKASHDNKAQLAELAEIGALRQPNANAGFTGKILAAMDRTVRLVLDDTFKRLVAEGVENTETSRREYVNQIGQYNRRLQGPTMRFLRDSGFGPFATAGRTFNAMGVKMATLSPNVHATSYGAAAALRANVLSKWVGAAVLLGTLNFLLTKNKGGGMMGRPGTPIGKLDTGQDDKQGRPLQIPLFDLIGLGRALRVTGIRGAVDAKRNGLTNGDALDASARDIINSGIAPAAGPAVRFATVAASGYQPAIDVGRAAPVARPGENQIGVNVAEALKEANPIVGTMLDVHDKKPTDEILARQIPRFTLTPGKPPEMIANYPRIVGLAQTFAYADYIVSQSRKMDQERRNAFINQAISRLDPEQQAMVANNLKRRKIEWTLTNPKKP